MMMSDKIIRFQMITENKKGELVMAVTIEREGVIITAAQPVPVFVMLKKEHCDVIGEIFQEIAVQVNKTFTAAINPSNRTDSKPVERADAAGLDDGTPASDGGLGREEPLRGEGSSGGAVG
jgi:hypothetical protein